MPSCRTSRSDDAIRIDTELSRVTANPAHGADSVLHAFVRSDVVPAAKAIIRAGTNKAAFGEVFSLGPELRGGARCPSAAEKENHRWTCVGWLPIRRVIEVQRQLSFPHGL